MKGPLESESEDYRKARAELLEAEIALWDHCERVAALRRKLPIETQVQDHVFQEGPRNSARTVLSARCASLDC